MTATKWKYLGPGRWVVDVPGSNACPVCSGSGYRSVELSIFADGNYSDAERLEERCRCNPEPTDDEFDDSQIPGTAYEDFVPISVAKLYQREQTVYDPDLPGLDPESYALYMSDYSHIDGTLPAHLLA